MIRWLILLSLFGYDGAFNLSTAFVISLDESKLAPAITAFMGIRDVVMIRAINATEAVRTAELPLYTRMNMHAGRHDHMQISNGAMLGCLLSHVHVWGLVEDGQTVAVLEQDALLDERSRARLRDVSESMGGVPWDIIMLEAGHVTNTGRWLRVGDHVGTCDSSSKCTWCGTRGYLLTYAGARRLLRYATPISVQVDALIGLVAAFDPDFKMFWTTADVVHQDRLHMSTVFDGCIKCYAPTSAYAYLLLAAVFCSLRRAYICKVHRGARSCLRAGMGSFCGWCCRRCECGSTESVVAHGRDSWWAWAHPLPPN